VTEKTILFAVGIGGEWVNTNYKYGRYDYIDAQWGLYNIDGTLVTPCIYDKVECYFEGAIIVALSGRYGLINTSGETIVECKYDKIRSLGFCTFLLQLGNKYGIVDSNGNGTPCQYDNVWLTFNHHLIAKYGNLYGVISHYGVPIIPFAYQDICDVNNDRFSVKLNEKWGVINSKGNTILPFEFDLIKETREGGYIVRKADCIGLLDNEGNELLPCIYDEENEEIIAEQAYGSPYRNIYGNADFLTFTIKGEEIYYDVEKEKSIEPYRVIECKDAIEAYEFCDNKACYYNGSDKMLILKEDKQLSLICITVNNADKYGLRNIEGMLIVREQYTFISRYYNGYQAWSYGNCDFYDKYGNLLLTSVPI
jgi:hypothetical protein